ncbi:hypothetical protein [Paenibacillus thermotolerans]|uniref:hypothetical protein n=1 Tax=Paenibacillus thermotolerans TaxID=3027807 RepID=UPI00236835E4|nr:MULTISPECIES: hypothetical protein [unclassified Paenibacillus]
MGRLKGLAMKDFWNSQLGCLKGCSDYLGIELSDSWLFGGTGAAFILHMDEQGFGAGAPWYQGPMMNLCNNLGFTVNGVYGFKSDDDFADKQQMAWENTKNAIDRGYPCYGYNLAIPEYYVVYGYERDSYLFTGIGADIQSESDEDRSFVMPPAIKERLSVYGDQGYVSLDNEETNALLIALAAERGYELKGNLRMVYNGGVREIISDKGDMIVLKSEGPAMTPYRVLGTMHIGLLEMYWVEPGRSSKPRDVVKESLSFALEHAQGPRKWVQPPYKAGLDAYDLWVQAVEGASPNIFALSYAGQCWAECRMHAASFLEEAAAQIGGTPAGLLKVAATIYRDIASHLQTATELLPFGGKSDDNYLQPGRLAKLADEIRQAKKREEAGLECLEKIVAAL